LVKEEDIPSVSITEEDIQLARGLVLQWALKIKPHYERKSTPELLEIYERQAYEHAIMSVGKRDDIEITAVRGVLFERGFEEILNWIDEKAALACWSWIERGPGR
jgi:hypothetical protein